VTRWRWAVPAVLGLAGFVFVTGAVSSHGADLRTERRTQLADLVAAEQDRVTAETERVDQLRRDVDVATAAAGAVLTPEQQAGLDRLGRAAGLTPVRGPGLTVTLADAPIPTGGIPDGYAPDDYLVHQQDVEAVVNALWAGGAQAVTVMGQRLIATSAVRCVGNTLILQGRVYSPPFVIAGVGRVADLQAALDASAAVQDYRQWAAVVGLGYDVAADRMLVAPAYDGPVDLQHAGPVPGPDDLR